MNDSVNIMLVSPIIQSREFQLGEKTVADYLKDPTLAAQLSDYDIRRLRQEEESINLHRDMMREIRRDLQITYRANQLTDLMAEDYINAIPIVLNYLDKFKEDRSKEGLIWSLSVPYQKDKKIISRVKDKALSRIIDEFIKIDGEQRYPYKWQLAYALDIFASDDIFEKLVPLVKDKKHGFARSMIILGLRKIKSKRKKEKAIEVLINLLDDEEVVAAAINSLRKMNVVESKSLIEKLINHKNTLVRNEAKKAIVKFNKV